jgi:CRISPR system Cascade subunit CasA
VSRRLTFNVLDEPWIPCSQLSDGRVRDVGLREAILEAHTFGDLADASPLTTASLHRLIIALLHSALDGPKSVEAWVALWEAGRFVPQQIDPYLDRWRDRFDLFHPEHPFYQRADLESEYAAPISQIVLALPTQQGATLFDHTSIKTIPAFSSAEAARALITFQAFCAPGTISYRSRHEPLSPYKFSKSLPLFGGLVFMTIGATFFETLLLNLHRYSQSDAEPMRCRDDDRPAWERADPTQAEDRTPDGYRDLMTWQSRRVRLLPGAASPDHLVVQEAVAMKGTSTPRDWSSFNQETMVAFSVRKDAKPGEQPHVSLGIRRDRSLWRSSGVLYQSLDAEGMRPRMFDWLAEIRDRTEFSEKQHQFQIDSFGVLSDATNKASIVKWQTERMPLPLSLLQSVEQVDVVRSALRLAEDVAYSLRDAARLYAEHLLPRTPDSKGKLKADPKAVRKLSTARSLETAFWPRLEAPFFALVRAIPSDVESDIHENEWYGGQELPKWRDTVRRVASDAIASFSTTGATSPRGLKAAAEAERLFRMRMHALIEAFNESTAYERAETGGNAA